MNRMTVASARGRYRTDRTIVTLVPSGMKARPSWPGAAMSGTGCASATAPSWRTAPEPHGVARPDDLADRLRLGEQLAEAVDAGEERGGNDHQDDAPHYLLGRELWRCHRVLSAFNRKATSLRGAWHRRLLEQGDPGRDLAGEEPDGTIQGKTPAAPSLQLAAKARAGHPDSPIRGSREAVCVPPAVGVAAQVGDDGANALRTG